MDVDSGSRAGPMMLLRLAELERLFGSKRVDVRLPMPLAAIGLTDRLDRLLTEGNSYTASTSRMELKFDHVSAPESSTSTDVKVDRRESDSSTGMGSIDSLTALGLVD